MTARERRRAALLRDVPNLEGLKRSARGKRLCRMCLREIVPPRRTLCSGNPRVTSLRNPQWGCANELQLRLSNSYLRRVVFLRDRGVCALCGSDERDGAWQADHVKPLIEGGTGALSNVRTLCVECHKGQTSELRARRAASASR